jgi:hypothetical protein
MYISDTRLNYLVVELRSGKNLCFLISAEPY